MAKLFRRESCAAGSPAAGASVSAPFRGGADVPQILFVVWRVARSAEQRGQGPSGAGTGREDAFRVAGRQEAFAPVVADIAHGGLVVDDQGRRFANVTAVLVLQGTAPDGRRDDDAAPA